MVMLKFVAVLLPVMAILVPIGVYYGTKKSIKRSKIILGVNIAAFFTAMILSSGLVFGDSFLAAETAAAAAASGGIAEGLKYLGAALSTGLGSIGAGIAVGQAAAAALGAMSENEGIMGKALIFVALAEGIAIYGLIISIMILMG